MPLEDPDVIDIVGRQANGSPLLVITDSGITSHPDARLKALLAKLNAYVRYVDSDDFKREYPGCRPSDVLIRVMCATEPTDEMKRIEQVGLRGDPTTRIALTFDVMEVPSEASAGSFRVSDLMQQFVGEAFAIVDKWLESNDAFCFIYWLEDDEKKFSPLTSETETDTPLDIIRRWAGTVGRNVPLFVQVGRATCVADGVDTDLAVAHCAERQESEGFILSQILKRDTESNRLRRWGEIEFVSRFANDILVRQ